MSLAGGGYFVRLVGDVQLRRTLIRLGGKEAKAVMRKGLRAGAKIVHKEAKANIGRMGTRKKKPHAKHGRLVNVRTGRLSRSLRIRAMRRSRRRVGVHVMTNAGWFMGPEFYAGFVEWGHRIGKRDKWLKKGYSQYNRTDDKRAKVEGRFFLREAADTAGPKALIVSRQAMWTELERLASK